MTELSDTDRDALTRAMEIKMRDPARAEQLTWMLKDRPWEQVAQFAAYSCQTRAMRLKPWETPPCHGYTIHRGKVERHPKAGALMDRLLDAGLSQWEPDPLGALAQANGSKRKAAER